VCHIKDAILGCHTKDAILYLRMLRNQPTDCVEQSLSFELGSSLFNQEMPHILWNPDFHYRAHNSPPEAFILYQINPERVLPSYF